jgi:hypothetical protein
MLEALRILRVFEEARSMPPRGFLGCEGAEGEAGCQKARQKGTDHKASPER